MPLRIDSRPEAVRRPHLSGCAPCESDRPLLLGEPIGELGRRGDLCLKLCPALRRERSVCKGSEFDDLLTVGFSVVSAAASHGHGQTNGSSPGPECRPPGAEGTVLFRSSVTFRVVSLTYLKTPAAVVYSHSKRPRE